MYLGSKILRNKIRWFMEKMETGKWQKKMAKKVGKNGEFVDMEILGNCH